MSDIVSFRVHGAIAEAVIDNPPVNATSLSVRQGLAEALAKFEADPALRALVVRCEGKTFIAGADIKEFGKPLVAPQLPEVIALMDAATKPIVAAVHGTVLGGGFEVALACHYRISAPGAKFGFPEVKLGLIPGAGGTQRIIRQAPLCRAKELMFTGDQITAAEAVQLGLVNRAVPRAALMDEAMTLARRIAEKSPITLKLLKRTLRDGADMPLSAAIGHEQAMIGLVLDSQDAHEGCSAFLEKRKPQFTGR